MKKYKFIKSVHQEETKNYIDNHPFLRFTVANYVSKVDKTHLIYQFTEGKMLWDVHFDPKQKIVFKICVYKEI